MNMTLDEIRSAVLAKEIRAISIDTSIFDEKQRGLEFGLLRRVRQFKDSDISFVLSEIVEHELEAHLRNDAAEAEAGLRKALKVMAISWALPAEKTQQVLGFSIGGRPAASVATTRLSDYLYATGAISISAHDHVSVAELVRRYFDHVAPFANKETKKHEFPDALAVLSLESWATRNRTKVVVVTKDGDWKSYCAESKGLIAIDDLAAALGCFQEQQANYYSREIAELVRQGDSLGLLHAVTEALKAKEDSVDVSVDADSQFSCEEDSWEVVFQSISIQDIGGTPMLEPVEFDGKTLVVRLQADVTVEITVHFSFEKWDSSDKEYMSMGGCSAATTEVLSIEVLLTLGGQFPAKTTIEDIEVGAINVSVSFTDLEPDWMNDPDSFD